VNETTSHYLGDGGRGENLEEKNGIFFKVSCTKTPIHSKIDIISIKQIPLLIFSKNKIKNSSFDKFS
jgi:hypothetical protein